jgi:YYY domain-containing protein
MGGEHFFWWVVRWWFVVQGIGLAGLPLTTFLFRALPDRGYAFSKSLGLLLTGYGAWLLAMFGLAPFGVPLLVVVALIVGVIIPLVLYTGFSVGPRPAPLDYLRQHWPAVLAYEIIFLLSLLAIAWMRSYNPVPWGTERPMDYAFFNAIQHSETFPPHDPWLAGYSINYYYLGYLLMSVVAMLSGLPPSVAFNLSLALVFALAALGVAGVLANLVHLTTPTMHLFNHPRIRVLVRHMVIVVGILLVLIVGNQAGALQLLIGNHRVVALDGNQLAAALVQTLQGKETIELPYAAHTPSSEFGSFSTLERRNRIEDFNWWWPSRTLWDVRLNPEDARSADEEKPVRIYNITEFPFFSFWLGDMHPHVMALPFGLLAMALALATTARPGPPALREDRAGWFDLILAGLILGSLYTINSWDLPTYLLLYGGAMFLLFVRQAGDASTFLWKRWGGQMVATIAVSFLLFVPFYLTFHSLVGSAEPLISLPILSKLSQILAPAPARSELHSFIIIFGLFLLPLVGFVYASGGGKQESKQGANEEKQDQPDQPDQHQWLAWFVPAALLVGLIIGFPLFALGALAIFAFVRAMHAPTPAERFALLVVALGCAICFGTDLVHIRDVFGTRMNTIFKFYYQTWLLWGTIAAYALWWLIAWGFGSTTPATPHHSPLIQRSMVVLIGVGFIGLLVGGLAYPLVNLQTMIKNNTTIGLIGHTPRENTPGGKEAIAWLRANQKPESVILEMVAPGGGSYNPEGYGGVSASTGIPTVLGWYGHESQWRGGDKAAKAELSPRRDDVATIYSTRDAQQARELLKTYEVTFIYVGELERRAYSAESLAKFDQIATPVFQEGAVTIYQMTE